LLIAALLIERVVTRRTAWRELLWRAALFGGVFTATLQLAFTHAPLAGRWLWTDDVATTTVNSPPSPKISTDTRVTSALVTTTQPVVTTTPIARMRPSWPSPRWAIALWIVGALLMSIRTALRWLRLRHAFADAERLHDDDLEADTAAFAARANITAPALFVMDALASPVALTGRRIVLPSWAVASLDRDQLRAMIAHETAHIARRDPAWKFSIACWRSIFWFVPSAFAQRRLDDVAELACDAFAAECLGNARGLAECLAVCAEHHVAARTFEFAPAMAARKSSLMFRIDRLLEGVAMETTSSGTAARAVALLTLAVCAFALPAIGIDAGVAHAASSPKVTLADNGKSKASLSVHSDTDDSSTVVSMSDDNHNFNANIHGQITLNDDETDIQTLSEGGTARLEDTVAGSKQRIDFAQRGGKLERHYFIDNVEHPYDDKARAFMAMATTQLARSGMDAEGRAKRLYAKGGAKLVLSEVEKINSDYVDSIYLRSLADTGKLAPADLDRAIALAGNFNSDYERRQALTHLYETQALDAARQVVFLNQVGKFHSDYDRAELLVDVVPSLADSSDVRKAWLEGARGLNSDYDRRRTYEAMLNHNSMNDAQIATVIEASTSMHSDYDRGELLKMAAKRTHDSETIADDYAKSAEGINSDYARREALMALLETDHFGPRSARAVLDAVTQINSSHERAQLLVSLARVMPLDAALVERYRSVAAQLPAGERGEAEGALVK
jgi:beta-lactamase regulating signal transducer with metallopeptidase domain